MITSSDKEYKATKRIKQGRSKLRPPFDELASWISTKWDVTVLNVIYDSANDIHGPRIQVIVEHQSDADVFRDECNFDEKKQKSIESQFLEIISDQPSHEYDTEGLFVIFSAFAPLAREEADSQVSARLIDALKKSIAEPDLWDISRCFGQVTFMFYTDEQAAKHEAKGHREVYACKYLEMLKAYDEFGYLIDGDFTVSFDSKQNLDENYAGSWFNYNR